MKILVTGGAGFIGSHLARALVEGGASVVILDNLFTGNKKNLGEFVLADDQVVRAEFIQGDARDRNTVQSIIKNVDEVYHLAAAVGVELVEDNPIYTMEANVRGTMVVTQACLEAKKRLFFASSSEVYGRSAGGIQKEDENIIFGTEMRFCYATSKLLGEFYVKAACREFGLLAVIGRYFNVVGPGQTSMHGHVLPRFCEQALRGEPLTVYWTGTQTRTFTWVGDAVKATMKLMKRLRETASMSGEVFNIGSGYQIEIDTLARMIIEKTGGKSEIKQEFNKPLCGIFSRLPDTGKLKRAIAYMPETWIEEIVDWTLEWHRKRMEKVDVTVSDKKTTEKM
jgi:UDP-glucose 4-epimerase